MKKLLALIIMAIATTASAQTLPEMTSFSQQQIFTHWVQNRCIGKITQDKLLIDDARKSAAAWLEFSQLPVEDFQAADKFIDAALKQKISGSVESQYQVLKCTLIANSDDIQAIFSRSK
ncbi:hypothetical protein HQN64_16470 [Enterobacteriaceae bacterium BIT-l23]|uniref:T6SS amidase immunity protein Tai4 family protein n=1 Tax=Jejubacter sp. L23 TaxID=3092086 RepID=UPI00158530AC|nr:hypothetical protein [Enterobacteriaceae bacterium BIT-l23]